MIHIEESAVPDKLNQAHAVFESTVEIGTPKVRRSVSRHLFLFTMCSCVLPVESLSCVLFLPEATSASSPLAAFVVDNFLTLSALMLLLSWLLF